MLKRLKDIWLVSDSQPTEITLALANLTMTHLCVGAELGGLYIFRIIISSTVVAQIKRIISI